jgi:hypothetical protein
MDRKARRSGFHIYFSIVIEPYMMQKKVTSFIPLLILIIFFKTAIVYCDTLSPADSAAPALHWDCSGMFGGKLNKESLLNSEESGLRNHGYFYSCVNASYSYRDMAILKTRLRLLDEELSINDDYLAEFEPEINLAYKTKRSAFSLSGGFIDDFTLGQGLTIKDFSQSGAIGTFASGSWEGSGGVFTSGYGEEEDLYWMTCRRGAFPLKLSAFALREQWAESREWGGHYYVNGYLLPGFEYTLKNLTFYAEYGYKIRKSAIKSLSLGPKTASAGLAGIKANVQKKRIAAAGCIELRASQKGFIPVTGVNIDRFAKFWNENDSRANWVDFFDSNEDFYWIYANIDLSIPLSTHWSVFIRDELLYFQSKQKDLIFLPDSAVNSQSSFRPDNGGAIIKYKPSTNYYNIGISFSAGKGISAEVSVKNKLMNGNGSDAYTFSKVKMRFFAMDRPFLDVRAIWNMGDKK